MHPPLNPSPACGGLHKEAQARIPTGCPPSLSLNRVFLVDSSLGKIGSQQTPRGLDGSWSQTPKFPLRPKLFVKPYMPSVKNWGLNGSKLGNFVFSSPSLTPSLLFWLEMQSCVAFTSWEEVEEEKVSRVTSEKIVESEENWSGLPPAQGPPLQGPPPSQG